MILFCLESFRNALRKFQQEVLRSNSNYYPFAIW